MRPDKTSSMMHVFDTEKNRHKRMKKAILAVLVFLLILIWAPMPGYTKVIIEQDTDIGEPVKPPWLPPPVEEVHQADVNDIIKKPMPLEPEQEVITEPLDAEVEVPDHVAVVYTDDWDLAPPETLPAAVDEDTVGLERPLITRRVSPIYPKRAAQLGLGGYILLEAILTKEGQIAEIRVLRTFVRGQFGFEQAAIDAFKQWSFVPGRLRGRAVDVRVVLRIDFECKR